MIRIAVKILPREVILDTQGRAVEQSLIQKGYGLQSCRVGKYIELNLPQNNESEALQEAKKMTELLLCNPLIEQYELEVIRGGSQ